MKRKFNTIKKSRKKSKDIDEKIEYLNKECQKTGLQEVMTTSNVYQGTAKVPNETYNEFTALNFNGLPLGLSGVKGSAGGASVGTVEAGMRHGASRVGAKGIAISPPHPVTGVRQLAMTRTGGIASGGDFSPAKPGQKQGNSDYPTGAIMWFWDPNFLNGAGLWRYFEYDVAPGKWGWWDSNFMGFGYLNHNLDQFPMSSGSAVWTTSLASTINGLKVDANGEIGTPQTTVLTKNDLDEPSFIPIDLGGLSTQGYEYLKNKANLDLTSNYYTPEDKKNVINYYKKKIADPNYEAKPYERESLIRQMRAQGDGTEIVSTDITTGFPPSPPDKEPVDPPPVPPSEPPAPPEPNPYPDEKANPAGLDDTARRLGWNDPYYPVNPDGHYIEMVTVAQDILSAEMEYEFYRALSQEESPNYNSAAINKAKQDLSKARANLDNWERWKRENNYIWKGPIDHAAEDERRRAELEKQQTYETEMEKLEKAKEQAEADAEMYAAEAQKLIAQFGMEVALTLFGGAIVGLAGKALGKLPAVARFFKLGKAAQKAQIDDALRGQSSKIPNIFKNAKNLSADDVLDQFQNIDQNLYNLFQRNAPLSTSVQGGQTIVRSRTGDILRIYDRNLNKFVKPPEFQLFSHELDKEKLLSEAAKLGFFEPEVLNVNIEKLRKGIMPEFPKNPPPEMINGYSAKSKLAPKTIEGEPFLKVTKKDLAKNHLFTDKEINEYMNEINAINDYIRKNPAELIHAMQRYPKDDPRLAQLNWEMDQKMNASEEYMETHFPENQRLFNRLQAKIKQNIELTDPKKFEGHKEAPKFSDVIDVNEQKKKTIAKYFKKPVKTKKTF